MRRQNSKSSQTAFWIRQLDDDEYGAIRTQAVRPALRSRVADGHARPRAGRLKAAFAASSASFMVRWLNSR